MRHEGTHHNGNTSALHKTNKNFQFQVLLLTALLLPEEIKTVSQNHKCIMYRKGQNSGAPKGLKLKIFFILISLNFSNGYTHRKILNWLQKQCFSTELPFLPSEAKNECAALSHVRWLGLHSGTDNMAINNLNFFHWYQVRSSVSYTNSEVNKCEYL